MCKRRKPAPVGGRAGAGARASCQSLGLRGRGFHVRSKQEPGQRPFRLFGGSLDTTPVACVAIVAPVEVRLPTTATTLMSSRHRQRRAPVPLRSLTPITTGGDARRTAPSRPPQLRGSQLCGGREVSMTGTGGLLVTMRKALATPPTARSIARGSTSRQGAEAPSQTMRTPTGHWLRTFASRCPDQITPTEPCKS
jgi:hypothetical protein